MGQQYFPIHINHPDSHTQKNSLENEPRKSLFITDSSHHSNNSKHMFQESGSGKPRLGAAPLGSARLQPLPLPGLPAAPCQEWFSSWELQWELCVDKLSKSESAKFILGTGTHNCAESKGTLPAPLRWQPASSGVNTLVRAPTKVKGHRMRPFIANCL